MGVKPPFGHDDGYIRGYQAAPDGLRTRSHKVNPLRLCRGASP